MDSDIFDEPPSNIENVSQIKNTNTINEVPQQPEEKETVKTKEKKKIKRLNFESLQEALPSLLNTTKNFTALDNRDEFKQFDDILQQYKNWAAFHWPDKHPDDSFSIIRKFNKSRKMKMYIDKLMEQQEDFTN